MTEIKSNSRTHIYFASDFHLGVPDHASSRQREDLIVAWLNKIKNDALELYILGDIFDFWFEYKTVIPKGFIRLQGKLAEFADEGIPVHFFPGNHDLWMFDYFEKELNVFIHREPFKTTLGNKKFYLAHGDGLGPGDESYKILKRVFANPACKWLFGFLHPTIGMGIASLWSKKSRISSGKDERFLGEENEWLAIYSKEVLLKEHFDYFIFGHRHLPLTLKVGENSEYINLGEWMNYHTYGVFDGEKAELKTFEK